MDYDKYGLIVLTIDKEAIDSFNFDDVLNLLKEMHKTPRRFFNKLNLIIHGYDDDNREVYEIPEIRSYIQFLDRSFPYWFYYLNTDIPKKYSAHGILATCSCDIESIVQNGNVKNVQFNIKSLETFILTHFGYMNEIMEKEKYSEKEIRDLSDKVLAKLT